MYAYQKIIIEKLRFFCSGIRDRTFLGKQNIRSSKKWAFPLSQAKQTHES